MACFLFILILRDFLFFFASLEPGKGAIWKAWGIESFCLLINKHCRNSKKKKQKKTAIRVLLSTHLPLPLPRRLPIFPGTRSPPTSP